MNQANNGGKPEDTPAFAARRKRAVIATLIGNFMEWFDFAVYGFVAVNIGHAFFPAGNTTAALLSSLAVFGIAFLLRPIGGMVLGVIGDRVGRRESLAIAIIIMSTSTFVLAILPTYQHIGMWATVALVLTRCVQGMSVGGEWMGAGTFIVEYSPANRRGLSASVISATAAFGVAAGSLVVFAISSYLDAPTFDAWGWRIPFVLAVPVGLVGLYMRLKLEDTPVFEEIKARSAGNVQKAPFLASLKEDIRMIGIAFSFASITGLGFYYFVTYMVNYLPVTGHLGRTESVMVSGASLVLYGLFCPLAGWLSDLIGRRKTFLIGIFGHMAFGIPVFFMLSSGSIGIAFVGLVIFASFQALINVMNTVVVVELFPPRTRMTSGALALNLGAGPVAGTGPLIAAALVASTGIAISPAFYLCAIALVTFVILYFALPETSQRSLVEEEPLAPLRGEEDNGLEAARATR
ncbi:MFS transporter [Paraburkholderia caballeronis]|uniref:MFS transporter n=1 Tax=Paraburkholderia caballeronis TaxID=416943 RepID=UPI001064D8D5|nr:MFS transporter [Paraburkholderia caballeronis]TDV11113.1 MHS family proline/betaine transporter-like MFS transporter [Paraburkholderia caballeronis]TDV14197.1 MHS family proline/betaine transporter-like MFS transporter [Paraburkholderia caballeronis]TDV23362.1 MHS family proline/betaine transporter-like MFS transporter [Paraburkholderia caballeronis]TDV37329.1 MHS family proline/betaine transporter-like MFS transporter [Paraburkholderia caballeronis]